MLQQAEGFVPKELHSETPVRLGATAGLRLLKGDAPERILEAVRNFLKEKSPFKYKPEWVTVLKGSEEGSYLWETANYLEGNLGKKYSESAGVVDLGGGSVQMAYAISEEHAAKAPKPSDGEEPYVKELFFKGSKYYLYVHSYLHYGLLAARAEILKAVKGYGNPCILKDYHGFYKYGGETYEVSASPSGSNLYRCRRAALKALKVNESTCPNLNCTFGGIWNGGGGPGQKNLFVASFFFDRASQVGFIDPKLPAATVRPVDFERAAKRACIVKFETAKYVFPGVGVDDLPYICMDLVYQFTLLVDGFGLDPQKEITLVTRFNYLGSQIGAAWPLGSAIEILSSSSSPASLVLGPGLDVYI
ncbi:hypothetical protein IFM89_020524 [Coptis chinensis]|uniref:Apyrase n=1 Tax=Coptis chinensis TaxID=261450 RepID=A0A835HP39_9MAGN|nr:hypothetical protein IFM89_020524 [Coptis chinensis]